MSTFLAEAIDDTVEVLKLSATSEFPHSGVVQIEAEKIHFATSTDQSLLFLTRAFDSTSAAAHDAGLEVELISTDDNTLSLSGVRLTNAADPVAAQDVSTKAYVDAVIPALVFPVIATDGSVSAPSYSFATDPTTGIFLVGADNIVIASDGSSVLDMSSAFTSINTITEINVQGAVGTPCLIIGTGNNGFYESADSTAIGVSLGNSGEAARFQYNATAGNTRFMLYDNDTSTLQTVSVGANDSGGTGFRLLKIPNA